MSHILTNLLVKPNNIHRYCRYLNLKFIWWFERILSLTTQKKHIFTIFFSFSHKINKKLWEKIIFWNLKMKYIFNFKIFQSEHRIVFEESFLCPPFSKRAEKSYEKKGFFLTFQRVHHLVEIHFSLSFCSSSAKENIEQFWQVRSFLRRRLFNYSHGAVQSLGLGKNKHI